jgi:hypothetical protein
MPAYPIEWVPPALLGGYPNMARRDAVIWEAWLRSGPPGLLAVAYNVSLGGVVPNQPDHSEAQLQGWAYSSGAKIDALCDFGTHWWVCEVKPSATLGAVGQALGYTLLAEREALTDLVMLPTIITDSVAAYMLYVCEQLDLNLVLLPQPVPTLADLPYPVGTPQAPEVLDELPDIPATGEYPV